MSELLSGKQKLRNCGERIIADNRHTGGKVYRDFSPVPKVSKKAAERCAKMFGLR